MNAVAPVSVRVEDQQKRYRVLFGGRPFDGESFQELGRAVVRGEIHEPPKAAGIPRPLRLALRRGLSVSRDDRHATMDALLVELERAMAHGRRRLLWIGGIGSLVLMGGVGGAMTLAATETEAPCPAKDEPPAEAPAEARQR